ncbi:MAG: pyruvate carboxylase subunit B [SAR202 cluster bacterium]|nr:pyruvate carboxylase subunit B [SAR202 cluster bacterium]
MPPIKITDTTLRDGHQSLMATRLRMEDMEPIAARMDAIGFHSMEVWGGATFDVATRFLAEDPWERLRTFKRLMPNTPLQMLLRGQSLVGYRNYADDVVDAFIERSAEVGIDIFRVFDALNDERNLERSATAVKATGKHLQMTLCYSVTEEGRLNGPIYNLDYYLEKARTFAEMGADSLCIKDMAGLLAPFDAFELISALKQAVDVPIQLHTHYTSGMASMTCLKAIEAGVDVIDTCLAPLALRTAQPAIEPLVTALAGSDHDTGLDMDKLLEAGDYLETILPKYADELETPRVAVIDARVLSHQIPGGMISNLVSQLRGMGAIDRLPEVLEEIVRTRKDMGYPPLVTPMSQMVGTQSVSNVLAGRYKVVSEEIKDYALGLYGRAPAPLDPEAVEQVLKHREGTVVTGRPADLIEPELQAAKDTVAEISDDIDDVLIYALYPATGMKFLRIKHGLDPVPDEMKPKSLEQVQAANQVKVAPASPAPTTTAKSRAYDIHVGEQYFRVEVDPEGSTRATNNSANSASSVASTSQALEEVTVLAPMPGIISSYAVKIGEQVGEGDTVVILEAMKMDNSLVSPGIGSVKAFPFPEGTTVKKGDVLAIIIP